MNRQNLTKKEEFNPTPKMQEYLETAIDLLNISPSKVSSSCGVSRETWYQWLKLDGFEDWFYSEYKKNRQKIIPLLDSIAYKYAKQGSFKHLEALYARVEAEIPQQKQTDLSDIANALQSIYEANPIKQIDGTVFEEGVVNG